MDDFYAARSRTILTIPWSNFAPPISATMGRTETDFFSGTAHRFDRANILTITLAYGVLSSVSEDELLERAVNVLAVWNGEDAWELIQFASAELVADTTWQLNNLLRGRRGTAHAMRDPVPAGSRLVVVREPKSTP